MIPPLWIYDEAGFFAEEPEEAPALQRLGKGWRLCLLVAVVVALWAVVIGIGELILRVLQ